ncbi:MAG: AbrB/MazE/SpoVT family DNA-binding domain-containing protein [candidate division KSB1 bacterium]|nr:AbrB/MazE/SpoVT family DNA-binding domain-containing protein [candidate division KSB1 bacterium]MDZ7303128.1 AbrB/MazE/SpoVT family DNA-binding domain-containing protein [candidate division KSB1 bacterium]MDZ7310109.1 AbrB/MazE/SpoVT family DNA-binding domain-containing protein [candidate division KSB1 bacterium]
MQSRIVQIGNSRGIRIPKAVLEQTKLGEDVELVVLHDQIIIRPTRRVRQGWAEAFRTMAEHSDDRLLDKEETLLAQSGWDKEEWVW